MLLKFNILLRVMPSNLSAPFTCIHLVGNRQVHLGRFYQSFLLTSYAGSLFHAIYIRYIKSRYETRYRGISICCSSVLGKQLVK